MRNTNRMMLAFPAIAFGPLAALAFILTCSSLTAQTLSGWELTFNDEFNGTQLDTNKWNTTYMWGGTGQRTLTGNSELEVYGDNQFEETNGILRIRADKVDTQWAGATWHYSSGLITSYSKFAQQYGYFEMRAKFPHGDGLWPAFWMLLDRQYWPPEVDILEILDSFEDQPHSGVIQSSITNWGEFYPCFNSTLAYHVYGMEWDTNHVTFYLDGLETWQGPVATNMTEPMQVLANLAVGGKGTIPPDATTVFPAYMDIDYIRVWSRTDPSAPIPATVGYDIGTVGIAGTAAITTNGTATVTGAGLGYLPGNSTDGFQYTAQPVPGDKGYDYLAEVSTRSVAGGQAGVMIRENMDAGARYAAIYISDNNCVFTSRNAAGNKAVQIASTPVVSSPAWLRLVRRGDAISAYQSADGMAWSYVGATTNDLSSSLMANSVFAGVAVSSGSMSLSNVVSFGSLNKPALEIIQDNADTTDVAIAGSWTASANQAGYYGSNYLVASSGSGSVRFTPAIPTNATYDVYLRWTAYPGRATNVPVTITFAGGSTNVTVNQQLEGGQWIWLGAFPFNGGNSGSVLVNDTNVAGSVCADAVRYVPGVSTSPLAPTPPDAPGGLTGIATPGQNQITLSWNAAARATSYNVKRGIASGGPYTNIAKVLPNLLEYTDTNVVAGTEYYYVVSAVNNVSPGNPGGQEGPDSNESAGIPSIIVDNANPTNVTIVGTWTSSTVGYAYYGTNYLHDGNTGNVGGKSVTFAPELPVSGLYDVYMRWTTGTNRASNVPIQIIDATGVTNTVFANEQFSYGVWWVYLGTFNFAAGNAGHVSILNSNTDGYVIADATEFVAVPTPPIPTGLTAIGGDAQVLLAWNPSSGATSYTIARALSAGGPYTNIVNVNTTNFSDTGLSDGTTYFYSVSAVNLSGSSPYCPYVGGTTLAAVPTGLTATVGNSKVLLNWDASAGAQGYNIKRATTSGGPYSIIATNITTTTFTNSGLINGTTYYYVVSATDAGGESENSSEVGATPQSITIIKDNADPTGIAIAGSWTASTNVAGYYGANYLYDGDPIGSGGKSVKFIPTVSATGSYDVYARWTANANRATNAPIDVICANGTNTFHINERINNGTWEWLGTFTFNSGTNGYVNIRNNGANGYVVADAVEFVLH